MDIATVERDEIERMKRFVKAELKRADATYEELATELCGMDFDEAKVSVANKLSRGTLSATFLIPVMRAIGREALRLEEI